MDTTNRLSSYLNESVNQEYDGSRQPNFHVYLNVFAINLVQRFPGMVNLDSIEVPIIENIAKLSAACSTIALDVWQQEVERRSRTGTSSVRHTRAA